MQKQTDTRELQVGQVPDIKIQGDVINTATQFEAIDKALNTDYMDELAFMEEDIEVMVMETSDENAENPVVVGCNGQFKQFFRGHVTTARRKFVDCLIVKSGRVTTPEVQNPAGERTNVIRQASAHKYPFTVVKDRNPKGVEWLRRRLAESI